MDPMEIDSFETEMPLAIASSLQDELERAVQHRYDISFLFYSHLFFCYKNL